MERQRGKVKNFISKTTSKLASSLSDPTPMLPRIGMIKPVTIASTAVRISLFRLDFSDIMTPYMYCA